METQNVATWAIVELLGHRRLGAYVTEVELFGTKMIRLDIPKRDGTSWTQFVTSASLYALTPVAEDIARAIAYRNEPVPVQPYELPAPRPVVADDEVEE